MNDTARKIIPDAKRDAMEGLASLLEKSQKPQTISKMPTTKHRNEAACTDCSPVRDYTSPRQVPKGPNRKREVTRVTVVPPAPSRFCYPMFCGSAGKAASGEAVSHLFGPLGFYPSLWATRRVYGQDDVCRQSLPPPPGSIEIRDLAGICSQNIEPVRFIAKI